MNWSNWIKKLKNQSGYLLLESLISLNLITYVLLVTIPTTISLIEKLEDHKVRVEINRALLDESERWYPSKHTRNSVKSYNRWINISTTSDGIEVESNQDQKKSVVIKEIKYFP